MMNVPNEQNASTQVLIVDDNADAGLMVGMLLRIKGYPVQTCTSGQQALKLASARPPQVILLDIGMPGMDGHETCRLLRQQPGGQAVVVIALSGYGQQEDRQRTKEAGFDGHLVKPVDLTVLTDLMNHLLAERSPNPYITG